MSDYLSEEIIIEILSRLPPKSVLRFRSVCKSWHSLISIPIFISTHIQNHTLSNHNPRKLVRSYNPREKKEDYSVHFENDSFSLDPETRINFPFTCKFYFRIVGSCNGVWCLSDDLFGYTHTVILWNPAIRRKLELPILPVSTPSPSDRYMYALGFGFDSKIKDFKVVGIAYVLNDTGYYFVPPVVHVYTVNGGLWRAPNSSSLPPMHCIVDLFWSQAFVNGAVHWVAYNQAGGHGGRVTNLIMTFHLDTEAFGEIMLPECLVREPPMNLSTLAVGDRLYVTQCDRDLWAHHRVWVMKEHGVASSWCKVANIEFRVDLGRALDVMNTGEIIFGNFNAELFIYHQSKESKLRFLEHNGSLGSHYIHSYRESLALYLEGDEICDDTPSDDKADVEADSSFGNLSWAVLVCMYEESIRSKTIRFLNELLTEV